MHRQQAPLHRFGKRHSDGDPPPPLARRPRLADTKAEVMDEAYVRRTRELPTTEDYPRAPSTLVTETKGILLNVPGALFTLEVTMLPIRTDLFRCRIDLKVHEKEAKAIIGEGTTKKAADRAAFLNLLAELHETGVLQEIYGAGAPLDKQALVDEADAKTDIYNYAARFDAVPQFHVHEMVLAGKGRKRRLTEVTVELPEQGISVRARGPDLRSAEITASVLFKAEAEKYQARHGEDTLVIKDATALNTGNVKSFFDYYNLVNRGQYMTMTFETARDLGARGSNAMRAQVTRAGLPIGDSVVTVGKKRAEELAWLTAAVALKREDPALFSNFQQAMRAGNGDILQPVPPVSLVVESEAEVVMRETIHDARMAGLTDDLEEIVPEAGRDETRHHRPRRPVLSPGQAEVRNRELQSRHEAYQTNEALVELRTKRAELPMNQARNQVLELIQNNMYSIVVGATGSGKTTQVPQILLEEAIRNGAGAKCNIVCTQPRRIAATSVARRVAEERAEALQQTVGYQVRFDAKLPRSDGSITYCTTGILLQQLQHSPDEVMDGVSHLIIDEVHERDILIDFLLIILKKVMAERVKSGKPTPNVVLMSATMDTELFAGYFARVAPDGQTLGCPSVNVPGRTFPVRERFFEDIMATLRSSYPRQMPELSLDPPTDEYVQVEQAYAMGREGASAKADEGEVVIDWKKERVLSSEGELTISNEREDALVPVALVATTIAHIAKTSAEGAILVFLPGLEEIVKVDKLLRESRPLGVDFTEESKYKLSMLHSSLPAGQTDVFNAVADGCRKVILATNIAETSITIPDVQFVVDTGKLREKRYDQVRRITKLQCTWISKSNSKQRAGRAGRVQNGDYYALFSKARYEAMRGIGLPEMLRSDLQEICLDIKAQAFRSPIREFLAEAIEPPSPRAVDASVVTLQGLEALTEEEQLTPLGRLLASLPVHPSLGKMIVLGVIFRCLDPMLILGAAGAGRPIFMTPLGARREADAVRAKFAQGTGSDHMALINAFRELRQTRDRSGPQAMQQLAYAHFLHLGAFKVMEQTARQIEEILVEAGLIPFTAPRDRYKSELGHPNLNENSTKVPLIKALALAGMHPNLAVTMFSRIFRTPGERGAMIHPSSINYPRRKDEGDLLAKGSLVAYSSMVRSADGKQTLLRDTSQTTPLMATLFGGRLRSQHGSVLTMDGWLPFYVRDRADGRALKTVVEFRKALDRLLTGAFQGLQRKGGEQKAFLADDKARAIFAQGLVEVLDQDVEVSAWRGDHGYTGSTRRGRPRQDGYGMGRDPLERFMGGMASSGAGISDFRGAGAWR